MDADIIWQYGDQVAVQGVKQGWSDFYNIGVCPYFEVEHFTCTVFGFEIEVVDFSGITAAHQLVDVFYVVARENTFETFDAV